MFTTCLHGTENIKQFYMRITDEETEAETLKSLAQGSKALKERSWNLNLQGPVVLTLCHFTSCVISKMLLNFSKPYLLL